MNTLEAIKRLVTDEDSSFSNQQAPSNWTIMAWVMAIMLTLAVGTFFLVTYPLQTMIVLLFMASIFFLDRG